MFADLNKLDGVESNSAKQSGQISKANTLNTQLLHSQKNVTAH